MKKRTLLSLMCSSMAACLARSAWQHRLKSHSRQVVQSRCLPCVGSSSQRAAESDAYASKGVTTQQDLTKQGLHARAHLLVCVARICGRQVRTTGVASLAAVQIPSIQEDAEKWSPVLKRICWYVVLASADSDQVTLLNTTAADKKLGELPEYKELLQTLIVKEVGCHASLCSVTFRSWLSPAATQRPALEEPFSAPPGSAS